MELKIVIRNSFPALLTSALLISFTTQEITRYNEVANGVNKAQKNLPSCFFISCFTVSVTPSIDIPKSSNDFITFKISFIFSFEISKLNPFPTLTVPFPVNFHSNFFNNDTC